MLSTLNKYPPNIILWGGTGQAKVVRPIIESYGSKVIAVFDDTPNLVPPFKDIDLLRGQKDLKQWLRVRNTSELGFSITIGNPHGRVRCQLHDQLTKEGIQAVTVVHPTSWVAKNAVLGLGTQVMAGAIIAPEAHIGRQCIINTKASIDHECMLDDGVEIAPGATLCGLVQVGVNGWIGAGATVLPEIKIGADSIIGAGSVITRNVPAGVIVTGIPGRQTGNNIYSRKIQ